MFGNDLSEEEIQKTLRDLSNKVANLENDVRRIDGSPYLDRNLDNQSKDVIQQELSKRVIDMVWNEYFYYLSYFDSEEGWDVVTEAIVPVDSTAITLVTSSAGQSAGASKAPFGQQVLSFNLPSRFRTNFVLGVDSTATGTEYWLGIGTGNLTPLYKRYGFRLVDTTMYGVVSNGTAESTVALFTTESTQGAGAEIFPRLLEARFFPGNRVDFYASEVLEDRLKLITSLTTNLPTGDIDDGWINFNLKNTDSTGTLAYDGQTGNFTNGLVITGGTSGATGTIVSHTDTGTAGVLTLSGITGNFQDNETITDTSTGSAAVNGDVVSDEKRAYVGFAEYIQQKKAL